MIARHLVASPGRALRELSFCWTVRRWLPNWRTLKKALRPLYSETQLTTLLRRQCLLLPVVALGYCSVRPLRQTPCTLLTFVLWCIRTLWLVVFCSVSTEVSVPTSPDSAVLRDCCPACGGLNSTADGKRKTGAHLASCVICPRASSSGCCLLACSAQAARAQ